MLAEVSRQSEATSATFTGALFQPVPYSVNTPRGMPKNIEQYVESPTHAIINIPPTVLFKSKIFKPSRLCAVFEIEGGPQPDITESDDSETTTIEAMFEDRVADLENDPWAGVGVEMAAMRTEEVEELDDDELDGMVI